VFIGEIQNDSELDAHLDVSTALLIGRHLLALTGI
jgi:hypothetical protein